MLSEKNYQNITNKVKMQQNKRIELLKEFLQNNKTQLIKELAGDKNLQKFKATIVPDSAQYLQLLGQMIGNGQLVGFPTQTVYGLGADATNEAALLDIYRVKRRPLTDPIIVHVLDTKSALQLVLPQTELELQIFTKLTDKYWPGPLTVILKANLDILPKVVTAQTGYVGIRSPKSRYARELIEKSKKPIGAPSANLFSHVSPTSAVHVLNDFYDQEIAIVDGKKCEYGVESTVLKIVNNNIEILRQGSLSTNKLSQFINKQFEENVNIIVKKRIQKQNDNQGMQAPGQLLKHYAPYLPCYSTTLEDLKKASEMIALDKTTQEKINFKQTALISFTSEFCNFKDKFKYYLPAQNVVERQIQSEQNQEDQKFCSLQQKTKMRSLYHLLRKAENLDVKLILIAWNEHKEGTLWDKIFRSTQGQVAKLL